jgi:RNA polymerase sigma-70 factor (ECF subfamily)
VIQPAADSVGVVMSGLASTSVFRLAPAVGTYRARARGAVLHAMPRKQDPLALATDYGELVVAIATRQDRAAFVTLFEHFAPRVKSLMLRLGAPAAQAEELAQDTMLAIWHKAHLFDPSGGSASGWIFRIARNLRIDSARRDQRLAAIGFDPGDEADQAHDPDSMASAVRLHDRVRSALGALSQEQLQVITMSLFEGRSHGEIAERLKLPLGTVKSRLRLAMKRLRQLLDDAA